MQAGRLNRRCTLQQPGTTTDALGQPLEGWTDYDTTWCNVRHMNGSEAIKAGAVTSTVSASIRLRYRVDLKASMRVVANGVVYEIRAVLPDFQRREYVDCVAEVVQ